MQTVNYFILLALFLMQVSTCTSVDTIKERTREINSELWRVRLECAR